MLANTTIGSRQERHLSGAQKRKHSHWAQSQPPAQAYSTHISNMELNPSYIQQYFDHFKVEICRQGATTNWGHRTKKQTWLWTNRWIWCRKHIKSTNVYFTSNLNDNDNIKITGIIVIIITHQLEIISGAIALNCNPYIPLDFQQAFYDFMPADNSWAILIVENLNSVYQQVVTTTFQMALPLLQRWEVFWIMELLPSKLQVVCP